MLLAKVMRHQALLKVYSLCTEVSQQRDNTFSSQLGDLGIQLSNLVALDKKESASLLLEKIGEKLGDDEFQSTQGIAWALMAASRYLGDDKQFFTADYTMNSLDPTAIESDKPLFSSSLVATQNAALGIKNTGGIRLYASVISHGVPQTGDEKSLSKGLSLKAFYEDNKKDSELDWGSLPNGSKIAQGTDIKMTVTVSNDASMDAEYLSAYPSGGSRLGNFE